MKKNLLLAMSICLTFYAFSQTTRKVETRSVQVEEIIEEDKQDPNFQLGLKTDVVSIILGDIPVLAEFNLGYNFSVEAGIFLTYNDWESRIRPNDYALPNMNTVPTVGFQFGLRYYLDEVFDAKSPYFEIGYRYKNLTRTYPDSNPSTNGVEIYDKVNRLSLRWGYQWVFINNFLLDFNAGVAYQFGNSTRYFEDFWVLENSGVVSVDDQFAPAALMVGFRLGYLL